jgi:hypothetical protein
VDSPNTLYLPHGPAEAVDVPIKACLPGKIAVLMDSAEKSSSGLYLPASGRLSPDAGIVVASGVDSVPIGTRVLVRPFHGLVCEWELFDWVPRGRDVRMLPAQGYHWSESVVARFDGDVWPLHDWVLIRREQKAHAEFDLTEGYENRGVVESLGYRAAHVERGSYDVPTGLAVDQRVTFHAPPDEVLDFRFGLTKAHVLVKAQYVQVVIDERRSTEAVA